MSHYVRRKSDGWYYVTTFLGSPQWAVDRSQGWALDVKLYADVVAERLIADGIPCEVESV